MKMPEFDVVVWETRAFHVSVKAADKEEAREIALETYADASEKDEFQSAEVYECSEIDDC
jgi:hypothetical protein